MILCPACGKNAVFWDAADTKRNCVGCPYKYQRIADINRLAADIEVYDRWEFVAGKYSVFVFRSIYGFTHQTFDKQTYTLITNYDKDCKDCDYGDCNKHNTVLDDIALLPMDEIKLIAVMGLV